MNKTRLIIFLIALTIIFTNCKKQVASKLEGTWRYWFLSKQDSGKLQYWEFREPNLLFQTLYYQDSVFKDTGYWKLEKNFLEPIYMEITHLSGKYDGTYRILKLNKKFLILHRYKFSTGSTEGAFLRLEFTREQ